MMQIYSYPECQTCLVKMCCQNICEEYIKHVYETRNLNILLKDLSLDEAESAIAMCTPGKASQEVFKMGRKGHYRLVLDMKKPWGIV